MKVLLSTAYWPNLQYIYYVLHAEQVTIEQHEHYGKQSFRNRCMILSANGILNLSIPIKKTMPKVQVKDVEIAYTENWNIKHLRAIQSAYNNSPYFEYFEQEIKGFYEHEYSHLLAYNQAQLKLILKLLRINKQIKWSENYEKSPLETKDLREKIDPHISFLEDRTVAQVLSKKYYQTFRSKFDFTPNLSILDLLFNEGLTSLEYLNYSKVKKT